MQIHLRNLKFYAFHGLYPEEGIVGGEFEVNLTITYIPKQKIIKDIGDTVDYTELYKLVKDRMAIKTPLLETLGTEIANEIISRFHAVTSVEISVYKLHPPIEDFIGSVGITYSLIR